MRGDGRAAAELWQRVGCPYEAAVALSESGAPDHLLSAAKQLSRLGGWAAMQQLNRQLRQAGVRNVPRRPRRPRRTTMAHPAGLTTRELEILDLVRADLRDADIAVRLHISPRTVGHHVSAILAKLGVSSRREAVKAATNLA
jgi:DNA-binding NarL/FixJ family response regulator